MMKDNLLHLNHGFPDGAVAYYEIDESGGLKTSVVCSLTFDILKSDGSVYKEDIPITGTEGEIEIEGVEKGVTYQDMGSFLSWKYSILLFILSSAVCSVNLTRQIQFNTG